MPGRYESSRAWIPQDWTPRERLVVIMNLLDVLRDLIVTRADQNFLLDLVERIEMVSSQSPHFLNVNQDHIFRDLKL